MEYAGNLFENVEIASYERNTVPQVEPLTFLSILRMI
jgi:hypothetical protein